MIQKSTNLRAIAALGLLWLACAPARAEDCFADLARTRGNTLGLPERAVPTPDGKLVLYLRSGPRDTRLRLFAYDVQLGTERELLKPEKGPEHLSVEEKARRERSRMTLSGITWFALSRDGATLVAAQADRLYRIALPDGTVTPIPGTGWIAPRLSPDGRYIAAVRDNDLHVIDLASGTDKAITQGGTATLTHGLPEFVAAEEFDREDGTWWSPDSARLVVETADSSKVEKHYISDPAHPSDPPAEFRYPRAGQANADTSLAILPRDGGVPVPIQWDHSEFPYIARVIWPEHGKLSLVLLNRAQTEEAVFAVDPASGATSKLLTEYDPAWIDLTPQLVRNPPPETAMPRWLPDGSGFFWATERDGQWRLELHHADGSFDHSITPEGFPYLAFDDYDPDSGKVIVTANPDRISMGLFRVDIKGGEAQELPVLPGLHEVRFGAGHTIFTDRYSEPDSSAGTAIRDGSGHLLAQLPSQAAPVGAKPRIEFTQAGPLGFDAVVIRPHYFNPMRRYPVVLSVYAGPTFKMVMRAPRDYLEDQCLADHGFIVVSLDGRGTPGRDREFERVTKGDLIDIPLQDQMDGLRALAARYPELDLRRVGVTGWSFGGYFTVMATLRHPELFRAGVAGAPVVDWTDYDTAYTERYLGMPQTQPDSYRISNVLTYAAGLSRPLLIMHGVTDDNVYFEHTMKLTQALITAGRAYSLLLLPGTHLLEDPVMRERVDEARAAFLSANLR